MIYKGHIQNGVAVPDESVSLPDGTPVRIEIDPVDGDFGADRTIADLAREQGTKPIDDLGELAMDWPEGDSLDDLIALVREARR